jgi:acyl-coenzyme A thioesterase PaaI-like protein
MALLSETARLRLWALTKIPLIFFLRPSVVAMSDERCVLKIRLNRRSRNHLGSMYFGALCAGSDLAGALMAIRQIEKSGGGVSLIFKDLKADFLRRCEGDVLFTCEDGAAIRDLVARARASGEREHLPVTVTATVPDKLSQEPAARFVLTLSLKRRS